jgi:hypothetical protein
MKTKEIVINLIGLDLTLEWFKVYQSIGKIFKHFNLIIWFIKFLYLMLNFTFLNNFFLPFSPLIVVFFAAVKINFRH